MVYRVLRPTFTASNLWVVLLLVAISLALTAHYAAVGFNPYATNDHDEAWLYNESFEWLVKKTPVSERHLAGYPPLILGLYHLAYRQLAAERDDWAHSHAIDAIKRVRSWTVLANALTAIFLFLALKETNNRLAGLLAALAWLLAPFIMAERFSALTEPWFMMGVALTLWATARALRLESPRWAVAATLAGLFAVVAKYSAFPFLGFSTGATLWLMRKNWRKWSSVLLLQGVLISLTALSLFTLYDARPILSVREPRAFLEGGSGNFQLASYAKLLELTLYQAALSSPYLTIALVIGLAWQWVYARGWQRVLMLYSVALFVLQVFFTLVYTLRWEGVHRYTAHMTVLVVCLAVWGLAGLAQGTARLLKRK